MSRTYSRFWDKVDVRSENECWPWLAFRDRQGYGKFREGLVQLYAHRVAWELTHGESLGARLACHTCDNPSCCNPRHIYAGDHKSNARDAAERGLLNAGRQQGETHTSAKLTWHEVREIRRRLANGETPHGLKFDYGVAAATIYKIRDQVTWTEHEQNENG